MQETSVNHFQRLNVAPCARLCPTELELHYLKASRKVHPDRIGRNGGPSSEGEALEAAALLNEAQSTLADPWDRYVYLIETLEPSAMSDTKQLDPAFLMQAMELGERVDSVRGDAAASSELAKDIDH